MKIKFFKQTFDSQPSILDVNFIPQNGEMVESIEIDDDKFKTFLKKFLQQPALWSTQAFDPTAYDYNGGFSIPLGEFFDVTRGCLDELILMLPDHAQMNPLNSWWQYHDTMVETKARTMYSVVFDYVWWDTDRWDEGLTQRGLVGW